jgi:hypothetical protein
MATLRMPDRLAREAVAHLIGVAPLTMRADDLLRMLISALGELPVESAHIATDDEGNRQADVVVEADDAPAFATLFPRAACVRSTSRGTSVFRLCAAQLRRSHTKSATSPTAQRERLAQANDRARCRDVYEVLEAETQARSPGVGDRPG